MAYPTRKYLVDRLIPVRSIALVSGCSGAAKTRWLFQCCDEWITHSTFLGYSAIPNPRLGYLCYDRCIEDCYDTLIDMSLELPGVDMASALSNESLWDPRPEHFEGYDCVILDGVDMLCKDINKFHLVKQEVQRILRLISNTQIGIIASVGTNKSKEGEKYAHSRERSLGSSAWGRLTGTSFNLDFDPNDEEGIRTLNVNPRIGPPPSPIQYKFNASNRLEIFEEEPKKLIDRLLHSLPTSFTAGEAIALCTPLKTTTASVRNELSKAIKSGLLKRNEVGQYTKLKKIIDIRDKQQLQK